MALKGFSFQNNLFALISASLNVSFDILTDGVVILVYPVPHIFGWFAKTVFPENWVIFLPKVKIQCELMVVGFFFGVEHSLVCSLESGNIYDL
jgi:hypothetical protein